MKKLLVTLAIVLMASTGFAWTLSWQPSTGAEGYQLTYGPVGGTMVDLDTLQNVSVDLDGLNLTKGQRYEFYVQAYTGDPKSFSGESDHLRWTMPDDPQIIELPVESRITINIY